MVMQLYTEQEMQHCELHQLPDGTAAIFSQKCPGADRPNQDAAALLSTSGGHTVLIIADGMGGGKAGGKAAAIAVDTISAHIESHSKDDSLRSAILNGIEAANQEIIDLGIGAGATLAVVEISKNTLRSYHIGDAVVLAMGQRGKIKLQTVCHSPVGYAVESGMLEEAEALHHEERHLVSNVLGSSEMKIDIQAPMQLSSRDTVLLSSDGLFDNLSTLEIIELSRKGQIEKVMQSLISLCQERMNSNGNSSHPSKPDDVTFIAFRPTQE